MKKRVLIRLENVILNTAFFDIDEQDKFFLESPYCYTKQGGFIRQTSSYYSNNADQSVLVNALAGNSTEARQRVHKRLLINPYSGIAESIRTMIKEGMAVGIVSEYCDDFCRYFLKMLELPEVKAHCGEKPGKITDIVKGQYDVVISSECAEYVL